MLPPAHIRGFRTLCLALLLALLPATTLAQESDGAWENLGQLRSGDKIRVIDQKLASFEGTVQSVSEKAITINQRGRDLPINREDVLRVSVVDSGARLRRLVIGAGIGAGAGLAGGVPLRARLNNEGGAGDAALAGAVAAGAGLGALAGLPKGYKTIYRAPRRGK